MNALEVINLRKEFITRTGPLFVAARHHPLAPKSNVRVGRALLLHSPP